MLPKTTATKPNKWMGDVYAKYPDDDSTKEVFFHKDQSGSEEFEKHVLFTWYNSRDNPTSPVTQIVQLTGNPGAYAFYHPLAKLRRLESLERYESWSLGMLTRPQRELLAQLADQIPFNMKSRLNNCQVWSRYLLDYALRNEIIAKDAYDKIMSEAALKPESPET